MQALVPLMTPTPGEQCRRFVGDCVRFELRDRNGRKPQKGWSGRLRTNLGRAEQLRREILEAHTHGLPVAGASWRDIAMIEDAEGWHLELPLAEVGYFKAKAYLLDPRGWQHWPEGPDFGISVHPDRYRTGNTIYCAFTRMFGAKENLGIDTLKNLEQEIGSLDQAQYTVIPPSGKLRDLTRELPHIVERLRCRILHLLPISPTPTTYARFGRFGSPYATLDLTGIDPALVVFDKRTTGIDQFSELTYAAHLLGARVFLDIVINHTGWGSTLQETHPEWFLRQPDRAFVSPGAWGVTWEDLVELKHQNVELWDELSEIFLTWCRRGVDGFRCDAGYKVPMPAWQYIVARVQQEYPETIFLLEGLGGAWKATEALLTEGGMQWAYSELFQNYSGVQVAGYLDHSFKQDERTGLLVHYSETHDNDRLAARGRAWSLLRNRLCGLCSTSGGFGFTSGVEWLATEKVRVHGRTDSGWDNPENLVDELAHLNQLLSEHPCFFDGARLRRLSSIDSPVYALLRESADANDILLVLVNTDVTNPNKVFLPRQILGKWSENLSSWVDLLGQKAPEIKRDKEGNLQFLVEPGAAYCLAPTTEPFGFQGQAYRRARAQSAWAVMALSRLVSVERFGVFNWRALAEDVDRAPASFLAKISSLAKQSSGPTLADQLRQCDDRDVFPCVVPWTLLDAQRITVVPPGHWLLLQDTTPFRAMLQFSESSSPVNVESLATRDGHIACFAPRETSADATLTLERYSQKDQHPRASVRFLAPQPGLANTSGAIPNAEDLVLLTNGRGGMARLCVDLGRVRSKYDCVLGANLHPTLPVDRHVLAKRIRAWINADGFISPLDFRNLDWFAAGPPALWHFVAQAGDGRTVEVEMTAAMPQERNSTVFRFSRPSSPKAKGKQLPVEADVRLTVRIDIEDRNFHWETKRNAGAEHHFNANTQAIKAEERRKREAASDPQHFQGEQFIGFEFTPASDRRLRVFSDVGWYHPQPEWSENIPHPIEQNRGQVGNGDAYSPGWFELPLPKGAVATLVATAEPSQLEPRELEAAVSPVSRSQTRAGQIDSFGEHLLRAVRAFVVRRDTGKTVIAGYPWFLDWGRDTFICARGMLAAGMVEEVKQLVLTFARFEKDGTLPNTIFGEDASNRDTSDAPLWFSLVCEELESQGETVGTMSPVRGRTFRDVLESIARNYIRGTPNRIRMDPASGLIWSPSHFTWMDTNYPAATPREGYPIEIQALWIRLLRALGRSGGAGERRFWNELADRAQASLEKFFWRDQLGYYADVLCAQSGQAAAEAKVDDALRSNCLLVISLGLSNSQRAQLCVAVGRRHLVVPGALRTLAPLPVSMPLHVFASDGRALNDPYAPYWGHYEGDEDTRRKPAYHNGTAWTWTFPIFCEALARAWDFAPEAVAAAKSYLGSMEDLMAKGCLGHLPEIIDGDAPHLQRGCDAQAWGATEALRVWRLLQNPPSSLKTSW
jgi:predicted glycogen debranching enzyme